MELQTSNSHDFRETLDQFRVMHHPFFKVSESTLPILLAALETPRKAQWPPNGGRDVGRAVDDVSIRMDPKSL